MSNLNFAKLSSLESENSESCKSFSGTPFQDIYFSKRLRDADNKNIGKLLLVQKSRTNLPQQNNKQTTEKIPSGVEYLVYQKTIHIVKNKNHYSAFASVFDSRYVSNLNYAFGLAVGPLKKYSWAVENVTVSAMKHSTALILTAEKFLLEHTLATSAKTSFLRVLLFSFSFSGAAPHNFSLALHRTTLLSKLGKWKASQRSCLSFLVYALGFWQLDR